MSDDFLIRPYKDKDEEQLTALWNACGLTVPQNDPGKDIHRKSLVNPEWFLIGEIEGTVVASCMAGYEGHRGWINYLAVAPHLQRRGIAQALMEHAEKLLREAGCPKINLQVRDSNTQAIEFYKSIGYTIDPVISLGKRLEEDR